MEMLADLDGIINKIEHRLILALRFVNFPLFCVEFFSFLMISFRVITHWNSIDLEKGSWHQERPTLTTVREEPGV